MSLSLLAFEEGCHRKSLLRIGYFSWHGELYRHSRHDCLAELFQKIADYSSSHQTTWDCSPSSEQVDFAFC